MSITIQQSPTTPNMANNTLVYAVTSNTSSAAQYQFVCDITYSGSATVLQRIKQQPNPNAVGVFDIGQIISNYLDSDNVWKSAGYTTNTSIGKRFSVKFGEEYGSSPSSSITLYTGVGSTTGAPAVTASAYSYFINGLTDPNDKINWNWPSSSYYANESASVYVSYSFQNTLTNAPYSQSIQDGEYATISYINGNYDNSSVLAQDIYQIRITSYDATGSLLQTDTLTNVTANGGGPRTAGGDLWSDSGIYNGQTQGTQLIHIGVGPQNLDDIGLTLPATWATYRIDVIGQGNDGGANTNGIWASLVFVKQGAICGYNGVRFAWKNEFGVWDYYTFTLQNDKSTDVERQNYTQTFVPFGDLDPIPYSVERRGNTNYYNKLTKTESANSNWLTQAEADWLRELFYSANVFQQVGSNFYPIVITSAILTEKTNPRTQKNFQYTIEFQPANQANPRL